MLHLGRRGWLGLIPLPLVLPALLAGSAPAAAGGQVSLA